MPPPRHRNAINTRTRTHTHLRRTQLRRTRARARERKCKWSSTSSSRPSRRLRLRPHPLTPRRSLVSRSWLVACQWRGRHLRREWGVRGLVVRVWLGTLACRAKLPLRPLRPRRTARHRRLSYMALSPRHRSSRTRIRRRGRRLGIRTMAMARRRAARISREVIRRRRRRRRWCRRRRGGTRIMRGLVLSWGGC